MLSQVISFTKFNVICQTRYGCKVQRLTGGGLINHSELENRFNVWLKATYVGIKAILIINRADEDRRVLRQHLAPGHSQRNFPVKLNLIYVNQKWSRDPNSRGH